MNKYPVWKYAVIVVALVVAFLYTLPNFFAEVPAVQVSGLRANKADADTQKQVEEALKAANIDGTKVALDGESLKVRFKDGETQLRGRDAIQAKLGTGYIVALQLISNSPAWLSSINALPMYLGLDLRGGVHFLMQVDMKAVLDKAVDRYTGDVRVLLRDKKIFYTGISRESDRVVAKFKEKPELLKAQTEITTQLPELQLRDTEVNGEFVLTALMKPETLKKLQENAIQQNITALRRRVNELGVSEPIVQQQGAERILVQLAGVQDPARAKDVIGRTASLEVRLVAEEHAASRNYDAFERYRNEPAPFGTEKIIDEKGFPVLVYKTIAFTGDKITDAQPGFDQQGGGGSLHG